MKPYGKTFRGKTAVYIALLLLIAAVLCVRAPYGLDWTDEPYYSVLPYRLWLGDKPLVDTWEVHQLSGLIALPFLSLYMLFTGGSTAGIMLYFRYVLLLMQLAVSLYAYLVLRKKSGDMPAFLAAGMLLAHVHFGINGFSYNAMTPLFLALSALLLFDALDGARPRLLALFSGAAYALAVQAYPYAILTLPAFALFFALQNRIRAGERLQRRLYLRFLFGIAAVAALFLAVVLSKSSIAAIWENAGSILHDPDHQSANALRLLGSFVNATRVLFGPVFYAAALLFVYSCITHFVKNTHAKKRMKQLGLIFCVAVLAAAIAWIIPYDYPNHHKLNLAAMSISLLLPSLFALSDFRLSRYFLLCGVGALLCVAVQLGSNTGIRSSSGMLLLCSIGTMLYFFAILSDEVPAPFSAHTIQTVCAAVCACQLLLTAGLRVVTVYRDAPLPSLTQRISDGPAKGVVTTEENAAQYAGVLADLSENAPDTGYLLVTNLLPVAYLMTDLLPATPSAFNMTADSPWLSEYYEKHGERRPNLLYAANPTVGQSNDISLTGADALADAQGLTAKLGRSGTVFVD